MSGDYKACDVDHNVKVAIQKLKEAYCSNDCERYANQYVEAENIIISAILFCGYTLKKEGDMDG